jgi:thiol-disulfide isomerase/thioredoxin
VIVRRAAVPATLFLIAALLAGCGERKQAAGLPPNVAQIVGVTDRPGRAPDFSWKKADGSDVSFDSARAKVTLVNFWATWCGPCKKELPDLVELSRKYSGRGFRVLGIATDRTPNAPELVSEFVGKYSIPYQVLLSTQEIEDAFGNVNMMPTSFLIDADGRVLRTMVGLRTRQQFEEAIEPLL